jgi:hypothetical protein|tara:strand:- start:554 stop:868 length:315 start_codon:yes stop_codon:yes gene_type:complete
MEISLFIIGILVSIIVIMVIGISINYVAFKSLKKEFTDYLEIQRVNDINTKNDENVKWRSVNEEKLEIRAKIEKVAKITDDKINSFENKMYKDFDIKRNQSHGY